MKLVCQATKKPRPKPEVPVKQNASPFPPERFGLWSWEDKRHEIQPSVAPEECLSETDTKRKKTEMGRVNRDPRGVAKVDYQVPCPGCDEPPRAGDRVVRIGTDQGRKKWWHEACRNDYLTELRRQRMAQGRL